MQSPWEVDQRNKRDDPTEGYDRFERSTSAPPATQTSLLFASRNNASEIVGVDVSFGLFRLVQSSRSGCFSLVLCHCPQDNLLKNYF